MRWPWRRDNLPPLRIRRVSIGHDDVVFVSVSGRIDAQRAQQIRDHAREILRTDRILVLGDGVTLDVARIPEDVA